MLRCRVLGHRYRFRADGRTMTWRCQRCDRCGGEKTYASAEEAKRFAVGFDRDDRSDLGKRAPLIGLLPLRMWRTWADRRAR